MKSIPLKFLISAGPTRESIDPVRFITNHSSGKMGYALANAVMALGFDVTLVSGPVSLSAPKNLEFIPVETAAQMAEAMKLKAKDVDVVISCAAVADYRPIIVHNQKMKKSSGNLVIELERTEDILASLGNSKRVGQTLVGFAAETNDLISNAQGKLDRKKLDWIVANNVGEPGQGFGSEINAATLISKNGDMVVLPLQSKHDLAVKIISIIVEDLNSKI